MKSTKLFLTFVTLNFLKTNLKGFASCRKGSPLIKEAAVRTIWLKSVYYLVL